MPSTRVVKIKHGLYSHPSYSSWKSMMKRCYQPKHERYKDYGGRGIKVCERWHDVRNFVADMGARKLNETLDRKDNNKDYELSNCRWLDGKFQAWNRRNSKLSLEIAKEIRAIDRHVSNKAIAEWYGIGPSLVSFVRANKIWRE